jgi:hypothetical protein
MKILKMIVGVDRTLEGKYGHPTLIYKTVPMVVDYRP